MKHTQGKWEVEFSHTGYDVFASSEHIASVKKTVNNEVEANAKLIASAPELLEALKELNEWVSVNFPQHGKADEFGTCSTFNKARTAIKKAIG